MTAPEWIPVHLHRVEISVGIAALRLGREGYTYEAESETERRIQDVTETEETQEQHKRKGNLIAGATIIVPDWEVGH